MSIEKDHIIVSVIGEKLTCKCGWEWTISSCPPENIAPEVMMTTAHKAHVACLKQVEELRFEQDAGGE